MKKVILFVFFIFLGIDKIFADYTVDFSLTPENTHVGEQVTATINIENFGDVVIKKMDIEGIDNFEVLGKSQSSQVSVENEVVKTKTQISILLSPKKTGDFDLGPIHLQLGKDTLIDINPKHIHVDATTISGIQNIPNTHDISISSNEQKFYGNKKASVGFLYSHITWYVVLLCLFFYIFYLLLVKYLGKIMEYFHPKDVNMLITEPTQQDLVSEISYMLKQLESNIQTLDRSDFFSQFTHIFKKYLEGRYRLSLEAYTYDEMVKFFNEKELEMPDFYGQAYTEEYKLQNDSEAFRKMCLEKLRLFIKK